MKVKSFAEDPRDLFGFPLLYDEMQQETFQFDKNPLVLPKEKGLFIAHPKGLRSRTEAEKLKGKKLFIERKILSPLDDPNTFYHTDLIGLRVVDQEGNPLGHVQSLPNFGAGDLLQITHNGTSTWIPFTQACVPDVNIQEGFVKVDATQLALFAEEPGKKT